MWVFSSVSSNFALRNTIKNIQNVNYLIFIISMEKKFKRTLITTALPYANGPVHIGHLAGVYVPADIYARYLRLRGEDVIMVGGSDEHGVPIKKWWTVTTL